MHVNKGLGFLDWDIFGESSELTQESWDGAEVYQETLPPEETFDWGGFFDTTLNVAKQGVDIYATYERSQLPTGQTVVQTRSGQPIQLSPGATAQKTPLLGGDASKILLPLGIAAGVFLLARK